jgi:hypothetical protein
MHPALQLKIDLGELTLEQAELIAQHQDLVEAIVNATTNSAEALAEAESRAGG